MKAKVSILLSLRCAPDCAVPKAIEVEAGTVREALQQLAERYPGLAGLLLDDQGKPPGWINLYVNCQDVRLRDGENTPLAEGDEIIVLSALSGG